jgi:hypothetical protein
MIAIAKNINCGIHFYSPVHTFEADYMIAENFIHSFIARFESVERKMDEERDELNRKIKKL